VKPLFFFEPLQLHLEPSDLLEQLGLAGLGVSRGRLHGSRPGEEPLGPGHQVLLPAVDERRVDGVMAGQFIDRLVSLESSQCDLGLERCRVDLPLLRHRSPSCWAIGVA
jgi:hypothetical protein